MTNKAASRQSLDVALENGSVATSEADTEPVEANDCLNLYSRELNYLIGTLRRLGVPRSDIDDVLHEIFLVMLRRFHDYDQTRPLRPWLAGIAFRVASGQRRRHGREVPTDACETEDFGPWPDDLAAATQGRRLLLKALAAVPLKRRAVLIMHEVDEISMRDIAEQLSIPLFTAYSRLRNARRELDVALKALLKDKRHAQ